MSPRPLVYTRPLPGGGYVAIDCDSHEGDHHARLWVERRADTGRRAGHVPPVIAEAHAGDPASAVERLQGIAADNVNLAAALRRWQADRTT